MRYALSLLLIGTGAVMVYTGFSGEPMLEFVKGILSGNTPEFKPLGGTGMTIGDEAALTPGREPIGRPAA